LKTLKHGRNKQRIKRYYIYAANEPVVRILRGRVDRRCSDVVRSRTLHKPDRVLAGCRLKTSPQVEVVSPVPGLLPALRCAQQRLLVGCNPANTHPEQKQAIN